MLMSDEGPSLWVVRDSVRGDVQLFPQCCCSESNRRLMLDLFCACEWGWQCGAHNEDVTGWSQSSRGRCDSACVLMWRGAVPSIVFTGKVSSVLLV